MSEEKRKPVKVGAVKKQQATEATNVPQAQNVDLSNVLMQMTQMMSRQWEMMKMMDERMKKLEQQNSAKPNTGNETAVAEPEVVIGDNTATYNREDEDYAEVVNRVWKIMYITAQAPVMRWDAAPMMETVNERRRVWNQTVVDTKYFNSEDDAKAYIENLRKKGTILPGAKIISCYI